MDKLACFHTKKIEANKLAYKEIFLRIRKVTIPRLYRIQSALAHLSLFLEICRAHTGSSLLDHNSCKLELDPGSKKFKLVPSLAEGEQKISRHLIFGRNKHWTKLQQPDPGFVAKNLWPSWRGPRDWIKAALIVFVCCKIAK